MKIKSKWWLKPINSIKIRGYCGYVKKIKSCVNGNGYRKYELWS